MDPKQDGLPMGNDLRRIKVRNWRQKAGDRIEWNAIFQVIKDKLKGP
jgi:hypothetical protein